jgi:hypothetical protein
MVLFLSPWLNACGRRHDVRHLDATAVGSRRGERLFPAAVTTSHSVMTAVRMHLRYLAAIRVTQRRVLLRPVVDLVSHLRLAGRAVDIGGQLNIWSRRRITPGPALARCRPLAVRTGGPCPIAAGPVLEAFQRALACVVSLDGPVGQIRGAVAVDLVRPLAD